MQPRKDSEAANTSLDPNEVIQAFRDLQQRLTQTFQVHESSAAVFGHDQWQRDEGGGGITCVLQGGTIFEKAGIGFSEVRGTCLPASATLNRPDTAGQPYMATGVSLVVHPRSPIVPTVHMNVRYFQTRSASTGKPVWWFGGGYDLTPYYPFEEDCISWHREAKALVLRHYDEDTYRSMKEACDRYFFLPHRGFMRGIGGLFFDDLQKPDGSHALNFVLATGQQFMDSYFAILTKRQSLAYGDKEQQFQHYRRGRYVEFNLVYDRGTLFGLQSGGRVESILMSLPPRVRFDYDWKPETGSLESRLETDFLIPKNWADATISRNPSSASVSTTRSSPSTPNAC
jgi:coproporphyrinogen III oxidase